MLKLVYWVSRGLVTQPTKKKTKREKKKNNQQPLPILYQVVPNKEKKE